MGHHDKCQARVRRHFPEQLFQCFQAPGRRPDADDREGPASAWGERAWFGETPWGPRPCAGVVWPFLESSYPPPCLVTPGRSSRCAPPWGAWPARRLSSSRPLASWLLRSSLSWPWRFSSSFGLRLPAFRRSHPRRWPLLGLLGGHVHYLGTSGHSRAPLELGDLGTRRVDFGVAAEEHGRGRHSKRFLSIRELGLYRLYVPNKQLRWIPGWLRWGWQPCAQGPFLEEARASLSRAPAGLPSRASESLGPPSSRTSPRWAVGRRIAQFRLPPHFAGRPAPVKLMCP